MMHYRFPYWQQSEKERRLVFQDIRKSPETSGKKPMTRDELRLQIEDARQNPKTLDALKESLKQGDPKEVTESLNELENELSKETTDKREELSITIDELRLAVNPLETTTIPTPAPLPEGPAPTGAYAETPLKPEDTKPEEPPKNFVQWVGKTATDIKEDFVKGDAWTKAGYIAGGVVGFMAARWLWHKAFGDGTNEGWVRKTGKWLLTLGAAATGMVGIKSVMDWWNHKASGVPFLPPELQPPPEVTDATRDIVQGAGAELATTTGKVLDVASKNAAFWIDLFSQPNIGEGIEYALSEGGALALENGGLVLYIGYRAIVLPADSIGKFAKWYATGKRDTDLWMIYGGAGAAYVIGEKAFNLLVRGQLKSLLPLSKKDALLTVLKIGSGPLGAVRDALTLSGTALTEEGRKALKLRYVKQSIVGKFWNRISKASLAFHSDEGLLAAIEEWKNVQRDCEIMENFSTGGWRMFSETEFQLMEHSRKDLAKNIQNAVKRLNITSDTPEIIREIAGQKDLGLKEFEKHMDDIRNKILNLPSNQKAVVMPAEGTIPKSPVTTVPDDEIRLKPLDETDTAARSFDDLDDTLKLKLTQLRSGYGDEALKVFDETAVRLADLHMSASEIAELLGNPTVLKVCGKNPELAKRALAIAVQSPIRTQAVVRMMNYIASLEGIAVKEVAIADEILSKVAQTDIPPTTMLKFLKSKAGIRILQQADTVKLAKTIDELSRLPLTRAILIGGAALEGVSLINDIIELDEAERRMATAVHTIEQNLTPANGFTKSVKTIDGRQSEVYEHTSGMEINVSTVKDSLQDLSDPTRFRLHLDAVTTASATASAVSSFITPSLALGPAGGLVVAGVLLTVHAGVSTWQLSKQTDFLSKVPLPILAMLGTAGTIGTSEYDSIANSSSWIFDELKNREVRKKAFATLFWQELGAIAHDHPEVQSEILGGKDMFEFMGDNGEFFREDFPKVIGPFLSTRLYQLANDPTAKWTEFSDLKIDEGMLDFANIDPADMRKALREAAWIYIQHLRQKRYLDYASQRKQIEQQQEENRQKIGIVRNVSTIEYLSETTIDKNIAAQRLTEIGSVKAFGMNVDHLPVTPDGKTLTEQMIAGTYSKLDHDKIMTVNEYVATGRGTPVKTTRAIPRTLQNTDQKAFEAHLPETLRPGVRKAKSNEYYNVLPGVQRDVPLWQLGMLGISESTEKDPAKRYEQFLKKAHKVYAGLIPKNGSGYVTSKQRDYCVEFAQLLQEYPEMYHHRDAKLKERILGLPSSGWTAYDINDKQESIRKHFEPVRDGIAKEIEAAEDSHYLHTPLDRSKVELLTTVIEDTGSIAKLPNETDDAGPEGWQPFFFEGEKWDRNDHSIEKIRANPTSIYVVIDGKEQEIKAQPAIKPGVPVDTVTHIPRVGTFICRASHPLDKNSSMFHRKYAWFFKGTDPGQLYVYHKNHEGIEQPGFRVEIKKPTPKTIARLKE